ncbi:hypothetical protein [Intestinibacter bartlettii]|uniref:Chromosome partition protein Smc n=1 Tax=Intestinibacter bartlettii TaxID=261299 RepID=A0ABS6DWP7_9FIRM|nr:hypothetical protein [Intestinibacter bartlettii]MBU5336276.1 hypothetical protein [Intestinibacter bartlettii]
MKESNNKNSYECRLNYFVCTSLCATKQAYKYIDKVFNSNKDKYSNFSKKCSYYNLANSRLLEEEMYFKKALGIITSGGEDEFYYILRLSYKKANLLVKNSKDIVRLSELPIKPGTIAQEELLGNYAAAIILAQKEGKKIDEDDFFFRAFQEMVNLRMNPLIQNSLKYSNIDKNKRKLLRKVTNDLCKLYPNMIKGSRELDLQKNDGTLDSDKINNYQRIAYALDYVYELEGLNIIPLLDNKPNSTPEEIQELINIWINCGGSVEESKYDILYSFIIASTKLRRLLETYKDAKRLYFRDIADIDKDKLKEKENKIIKISQEKTDLKAKYTKTTSELEKENEELKEKIRLLENKNKHLQEELNLEPDLKEELTELRNLMFNLSHDIDNSHTENNTKVDIDKLNNLNAICIGGTDSWINSMKEVLPNWVFIGAGFDNFDTALLKHKNYIFINTISNTHSMYYRVIENKDKATKLRYINALNRDRVLFEIEKSL